MDIFNHYIKNSFAAYPDKPLSYEFFGMLKGMSRGGCFYVIETGDNKVVGFGMLRHHQHSETFKQAAEPTYFISPEFSRRGCGTRLLKILEDEARKMGVKTLLANISSLNEQSLAFHRENGFIECGRFKAVGRKLDRDFDVIWMQKFL